MKYIPEVNNEKIKGKYIVSSHRRSGSHFFLAALRNYRSRYRMDDGTIRHWKPDHPFLSGYDLSSIINIVRDGRDTLVSCYYYYQKIDELKDKFLKASFQDYLYGKIEIKEPNGILGQHWTEQMFYDPIGYWVDFVQSWLPFGILVKYETLLENFDIPLCGRHHRKGIKGDYLNYFTDKDNKYFLSKAGELMERLSYV